jgi:hypothetical protein
MRLSLPAPMFPVAALFAALSLTFGTSSGYAQALTTEFNITRAAVYTYPTTPQTFFNSASGPWQVVTEAQFTSVAATLDNFVAYAFGVYSTGFSSGAVVSLAFVDVTTNADGTCANVGKIHQVATMVVDQLDGDLYMHGSFGADGWSPGPCGYVAPIPAINLPPITVTLIGKTTG